MYNQTSGHIKFTGPIVPTARVKRESKDSCGGSRDLPRPPSLPTLPSINDDRPGNYISRDRRDVRTGGAVRSIVLEARGGVPAIFIFQNFHCESVSGPRGW